MTRPKIFCVSNRADLRSALAALTPAQRRVLNELLRGRDAAGVAQDLGLATVTIHNHTRAIYAAFGVASRVELMALFVVRP